MATELMPAGLKAQMERFNVTPVGTDVALSDQVESASLRCHSTPGLEPAVKIDPSVHVHAVQTDEQCAEACKRLRALLEHDPVIVKNGGLSTLGFDSGALRRYLTARQNNPEKAKQLLLTSLEIRFNRLPGTINWDEMEREAQTGKMRVSGLDRHGRPVVVIDFSAQNTQDCQAHLRFVAFNLDHAVSRMVGHVEKYVIFVHLSKFTYRSSPPRAFIKEMCEMLNSRYPERCGNMILYQAPSLFSTLYSLVKPFVDPRTSAKFVFITGPGSANDATLHEVVGARWRSLTGVGMPCEGCKSSPGYEHSRDWGMMLSYECSKYKELSPTPTPNINVTLETSKADDEKCSDASTMETDWPPVGFDTDTSLSSRESSPRKNPAPCGVEVSMEHDLPTTDFVDAFLLPVVESEYHAGLSTKEDDLDPSLVEALVKAQVAAKEAAIAAHEASKAAHIATQAAASATMAATELAQTVESLRILAKPEHQLAKANLEHSKTARAQVTRRHLVGDNCVNIWTSMVSTLFRRWWVFGR